MDNEQVKRYIKYLSETVEIYKDNTTETPIKTIKRSGNFITVLFDNNQDLTMSVFDFLVTLEVLKLTGRVLAEEVRILETGETPETNRKEYN